MPAQPAQWEGDDISLENQAVWSRKSMVQEKRNIWCENCSVGLSSLTWKSCLKVSAALCMLTSSGRELSISKRQGAFEVPFGVISLELPNQGFQAVDLNDLSPVMVLGPQGHRAFPRGQDRKSTWEGNPMRTLFGIILYLWSSMISFAEIFQTALYALVTEFANAFIFSKGSTDCFRKC